MKEKNTNEGDRDPSDFLPDEKERKGRPGCPGGASPWPSGCFEKPEQPGGCWGTDKKP